MTVAEARGLIYSNLLATHPYCVVRYVCTRGPVVLWSWSSPLFCGMWAPLGSLNIRAPQDMQDIKPPPKTYKQSLDQT